MRINIVTGFFLPVPPVRGGSTEKIWHRLAVEFAAAGHEVTFISRSWPGFSARETLDGVHHVRIKGADHTASLPRNLWLDFRWGLRAATSLPAADVTICNNVTLPIWLRRRHPRVGRVAAVIARMPRGQARFYGSVDLLLALSAAVRDALIHARPDLASRIALFPYPIDWNLHARAARLPDARDRSPVTIGYVGRIHPEKGIHLLVQAAAHLRNRSHLPPWTVSLTGPTAIAEGGGGNDYLARLRSSFGNEMADRLQVAGPEFDPRRLADVYAHADIFCYPSVSERGETFGVAVAEAMAAGAVPVVSNLSCFRDLVSPTQTGFVFDHRSPQAAAQLETILVRLIEDDGLRKETAARAQAHVRQFDYRTISDLVLRHLQSIAAN